MPANTFRLSTSGERIFSIFTSWKYAGFFSVPFKLKVVNILVIISGFFAIIGAYEIQLGGKMHELNYFHQKYTTEMIKAVKAFESEKDSIDKVEGYILLVRHQPEQCIALIGPVELYMMKLIGTDMAIKICNEDILIAIDLLKRIQAFKAKEIDKTVLLNSLHEGIGGFESHGALFEPLIGKTVKITFFIVITILIASAFIVSLFGLLISRSVSNDYQTLLKTKFNLQEEKNRNVMIQAERMASLTTMVAGVAHEINTPVGVSISANSHSTAILNKIKRAYKLEELTEAELECFFNDSSKVNEIVNNNLQRTSELIKSFKQISVDQSVDDLQTINLKPYIEKILLTLTPLTKSTGIKVKFMCQEVLRAKIHGGTLSQVITNLMTNAVNHAFEQSKQGTLSISVSKTTEQEVRLSIADDGCGISDVEQIHIFEPFYTTKRGSGGTGLGLYILHNLVVDKLKGRVQCSSKIDKGTQFDIYFPTGLIE